MNKEIYNTPAVVETVVCRPCGPIAASGGAGGTGDDPIPGGED